MRLELDNYSRIVLTIITVLLTFITTGLWLDADTAPEVYGQRLNTAEQRLAMVRELEKTNSKLDEIKQILIKGQVKVEFVTDEENKAQKDSVAGKR